jgi:hypothetical protein
METKLFLNVITILINSFLIVSTYVLIKELNIHTVHFVISVFISFIREITRFRCIYLINAQQLLDNRRSIQIYYYLLLFLKLVNVMNIFLIIMNEKQYEYIDYKFIILYFTYDIVCILVIPKINIETNIPTVPLPQNRINYKKKILNKILINLEDYNNIDECYICCYRKGNNTILDCNHNMICDICISKINKCPICRGNITQIMELTID